MKKKLFLVLVYSIPVLALGQESVSSIAQTLTRILNDPLMPFLVGLALVFFIIGVLKYIMAQDNESGRTAARQMMVNGIIALFVIVSVWGLVLVVSTTVGVNTGGTIAVPPVPGI